MILFGFVLNILAASMLLLFAVKQVRIGIERSFGKNMHSALKQRGPMQSCMSGVLLAVLFQGATGVVLMTAGLVSAGAMPLFLGLALTLGADFGSAIVIKILTFDLTLLLPILLLLGGTLHLKRSNPTSQNLGRAILGVALLLLSLKLISEAVTPIKGFTHLSEISAFLDNDQMLVLFAGAAITLLLHSSVASILLAGILFIQGDFSAASAASFVFGCNIGSALIPVWLTRGAKQQDGDLPVVNLALRGTSAGIFFILFLVVPISDILFDFWGRTNHLVGVHLLFNAANLLLVPFSASICAAYLRFRPQHNEDTSSSDLEFTGAALSERTTSADLRLVLRRDVASMLEVVSRIIADSGLLIENHDTKVLERLERNADALSSRMNQLRSYYASNAQNVSAKSQLRQNRHLFEYALRLNRAGQSLSASMRSITSQLNANGLELSKEGIAELLEIQQNVLNNSLISFDIVASSSRSLARQIVERKKEISLIEQRSRRRHFERLAQGNLGSFLTSDLHVELAEELKATNNKIASYAFAMLEAKGELNETRLRAMGGH